MDFTVPSSIDVATNALRVFAVVANVWIGLELRALLRRRGWRSAWLPAGALVCAGLALTSGGDLFRLDARLLGWASRAPSVWGLCAAVWTIGACGAFAIELTVLAWRKLGAKKAAAPAGAEPAAGRLTRRAALAAPFAVAGYGVFIEREKFRLREVEMAVPNLPDDLVGLRIGQVTDIHAGPFLAPKEVHRIVAMVNETKPHVAVVTGDLITRRGDPLHAAIDALAGLRADAGVWGCMGNHEQYARCRGEAQVYAQGKGIEFLRHSARNLRFGAADLNLVGVDYQRQGQPYLVGAGERIEPGAVNLLLSHNPDVFPVAAELGFDLVLSGHTHGGQITLEIVEQTLNPGRFMTPFVSGLYRIGGSSLYVSRGVGTVTLPMRLGAEPEVASIRLRRA
jgi:predicted MPP superfamily phosphohydrolase